LAESFQRVAFALERRDFTGVTESDLAAVSHEHANKLYRAWVAGGKVPLPLHDPEDGDDCVKEVLVRVATRTLSTDGKRFRMSIEHEGPLKLFAGDMIFIRRASPLPDPERLPPGPPPERR
jgi:hypothetical protein